jgi:hypothetical protein
MTQAQKVFEAMMRAKGYTDFSGTKGRYSVPALHRGGLPFSVKNILTESWLAGT